ncbi:uncharacterized protein MYCFIDRAFT_135774, partial [Pseudocercospora fijiensis CIRAD86]
LTFNTAKQFIIMRKAEIYRNFETAAKIINANNPAKQKLLGRTNKHREAIAEQGNYLKFKANPRLLESLLGTSDRKLVEALLTDRI